jgi:hypothetical protein
LAKSEEIKILVRNAMAATAAAAAQFFIATVKDGDISRVRELLASGVDVNFRDEVSEKQLEYSTIYLYRNTLGMGKSVFVYVGRQASFSMYVVKN